MTIKKENKIYTVKENKTSWTLSTKIGQIDISYNVPKSDCADFDTLTKYVISSNLF